MGNQNWNQIGNEIKDIVQKAVSTQDFSQLNESVSNTVRDALSQVGQGLQDAASSINARSGNGEYIDPDPAERARKRPRERAVPHGAVESADGERIRFTDRWVNQPAVKKELPGPFARVNGLRTRAYAQAVGGGIFTAGLGVGLLVSLLTMLLTGFSSAGGIGGTAVLAVLLLGSSAVMGKGMKKLGYLNRFRDYVRLLKGRTYYELEELSKRTGRKLKIVKKDMYQMLEDGLFTEGHLDQQETCLIVTNAAYEQYQTAQKEYEERQRREALMKSEEKTLSPEVESILKEGEEYLEKIHICNERIPGLEISEKITRMEFLVQRIFEQVKKKPDAADELQQMMDYYLPTTVKLLDAYAEMDSQPVQGENIRSSKKEIEDTLDTLNLAFEKLLDEIFKDIAWDVSTDISVLHTLLAQEGLTKKDFV